MQAYGRQDFRGATAALAAIPVGVPGSGRSDEHVTDAGVQLYLGISQLMLNQNAAALRALQRSAAYGDTPYLENATFYLAKGLIRQRQFPQAVVELKRVVELNGDRQSEARTLLAQITATH